MKVIYIETCVDCPHCTLVGDKGYLICRIQGDRKITRLLDMYQAGNEGPNAPIPNWCPLNEEK